MWAASAGLLPPGRPIAGPMLVAAVPTVATGWSQSPSQPGGDVDRALLASPQCPCLDTAGASRQARPGVRGPGLGPRTCSLRPAPAPPGAACAGRPGCRGGPRVRPVRGVPARPLSLTRPLSAYSARGGGTPGQGCPSFCRHPRRLSSLRLERSPSPGTRSSTWPAPLTCSVSSRTGGVPDGAGGGAPPSAEGLRRRVWGPLLLPGDWLLNLGADIGHVDFLEKVHSLAERPYVIAGLHFDQVSTPGIRSGGLQGLLGVGTGGPCGARPRLLTEAEETSWASSWGRLCRPGHPRQQVPADAPCSGRRRSTTTRGRTTPS